MASTTATATADKVSRVKSQRDILSPPCDGQAAHRAATWLSSACSRGRAQRKDSAFPEGKARDEVRCRGGRLACRSARGRYLFPPTRRQICYISRVSGDTLKPPAEEASLCTPWEGDEMIRECTTDDAERICFVVNEAAEAYRGVIPDDCWHEPYMPLEELRREMAGMTFFGWDGGDGLVGVMGYQPLGEVTLVRHAYVLSTRQGEGDRRKAARAPAGDVDSEAACRDVAGGDVGGALLRAARVPSTGRRGEPGAAASLLGDIGAAAGDVAGAGRNGSLAVLRRACWLLTAFPLCERHASMRPHSLGGFAHDR